MSNKKIHISNKTVAYKAAMVAIAGVLGYSLLIMIYAIIRSSFRIFDMMPDEERSNILFFNGFSIAYSVAVFSILMALLSSAGGAIAALILKKSLLIFNPQFEFRKAIYISCITGLMLLIIIYVPLRASLKDWMTFNYAETFTFWFVLPAIIFMITCIIGGGKLNEVLNTGTLEVDNNINKNLT